MGNHADASGVSRNSPYSYARYMWANPGYFESLFRMRFSEDNLEKAVSTMFPGRTTRREIMANKPGKCANCGRGPMSVRGGLCGTCDKAAAGLTGQAREKALIDVKDKIDRGEVKPRGRNAKLLRLVTVDNGGAFSEKTQEALNKGVEEKARERAESGASAPGSVREVPRSPRDSGAKVEAQLRGLLRLIDETAKMGLATEITVSIKIGGIEA